MEDHALGVEPVGRSKVGAVGLADLVGVDDSLRQAGGARGVDDVEDVVPVDGDLGRLLLRGCLGQGPVGQPAVWRLALGEDERIGVEVVSDRLDVGDHVGLSQHRHRVGVVDEVGQAGAPEQRAERDHHDAGLGGNLVDLDDLDRVGEDRGDLLALLDADVRQRIGEPVHPAVELFEREPMLLEHEGELVGVVAGVAGEQLVERHLEDLGSSVGFER